MTHLEISGQTPVTSSRHLQTQKEILTTKCAGIIPSGVITELRELAAQAFQLVAVTGRAPTWISRHFHVLTVEQGAPGIQEASHLTTKTLCEEPAQQDLEMDPWSPSCPLL